MLRNINENTMVMIIDHISNHTRHVKHFLEYFALRCLSYLERRVSIWKRGHSGGLSVT